MMSRDGANFDITKYKAMLYLLYGEEDSVE